MKHFLVANIVAKFQQGYCKWQHYIQIGYKILRFSTCMLLDLGQCTRWVHDLYEVLHDVLYLVITGGRV